MRDLASLYRAAGLPPPATLALGSPVRAAVAAALGVSLRWHVRRGLAFPAPDVPPDVAAVLAALAALPARPLPGAFLSADAAREGFVDDLLATPAENGALVRPLHRAVAELLADPIAAAWWALRFDRSQVVFAHADFAITAPPGAFTDDAAAWPDGTTLVLDEPAEPSLLDRLALARPPDGGRDREAERQREHRDDERK